MKPFPFRSVVRTTSQGSVRPPFSSPLASRWTSRVRVRFVPSPLMSHATYVEFDGFLGEQLSYFGGRLFVRLGFQSLGHLWISSVDVDHRHPVVRSQDTRVHVSIAQVHLHPVRLVFPQRSGQSCRHLAAWAHVRWNQRPSRTSLRIHPSNPEPYEGPGSRDGNGMDRRGRGDLPWKSPGSSVGPLRPPFESSPSPSGGNEPSTAEDLPSSPSRSSPIHGPRLWFSGHAIHPVGKEEGTILLRWGRGTHHTNTRRNAMRIGWRTSTKVHRNPCVQVSREGEGSWRRKGDEDGGADALSCFARGTGWEKKDEQPKEVSRRLCSCKHASVHRPERRHALLHLQQKRCVKRKRGQERGERKGRS